MAGSNGPGRLTAAGAVITGAEIFLEHDRASFGNQMMWIPVALDAGGDRRRDRGRVSAAGSQDGAAGGVGRRGRQRPAGSVPALRGIAQRPGGLRIARYNAEMGPPAFAPLLFALVGGMGLLAVVLRREALSRVRHDAAARRSRPLPGLRRPGRSDDLGRGHAGVVLAVGPPPAAAVLHADGGGDRPARCSTGCSARTTSRACRSSS